MKTIMAVILVALILGSCSMPYDGTSYIQYSGVSIDRQIEDAEEQYGPLIGSLGPIFQSQSWWYYIMYTDGTEVWYNNDSGPETPDYEVFFTFPQKW